MTAPTLGRRAAALTLSLILGASMTACGSDNPDEALPPAQQKVLPTGTPSPTLTPSDVSSQWRTVKGERFTIGVPATFREQVTKTSKGTDMWLFDAPRSGKGEDLVRVAVIPDKDPKSSAIEQSYVLEQTQSIGENKVTRSTVAWPTGQRAILVQWSNPPSGDQDTGTETWQLFVQVDAKLILNVVAVAPEGQLTANKLDQIISTFRTV
ncbi:hypothetical protein [Janibacter sp. G1551]|uniref:hypothetical protein n=1 Tax=Janibacter sp. G1551 TaxID=3420440 RepID=UPI003D013D9F